MNKDQFDETVKRLEEVNTVIAGLDENVRSDAFRVLEPYITNRPASSGTTSLDAPVNGTSAVPGSVDVTELAEQGDNKRPSKNVYIAAAHFYQVRGLGGFTTKEVKGLLDTWGLIYPARMDKTLQGAKDKGKALFNNNGQTWKPTVSGETYLVNKFGVKKGQPGSGKES